MNTDIKSVREIWNCLFDNSLENFAKEDVQFRSLAMVLHILQLEFKSNLYPVVFPKLLIQMVHIFLFRNKA